VCERGLQESVCMFVCARALCGIEWTSVFYLGLPSNPCFCYLGLLGYPCFALCHSYCSPGHGQGYGCAAATIQRKIRHQGNPWSGLACTCVYALMASLYGLCTNVIAMLMQGAAILPWLIRFLD